MDQEDMTTAWFSASSFTQIRNPSTASTVWESSYDEPGMLSALSYVYSLIEAELERGVKLERIVVGGFSQGCVMAMLTGLGGRYKGRLGAVVGLSGALPPERAVEKADEMAKNEGVSKKVADEGKGKDAMQIFFAHGTKDMLMPIRVFRSAVEKLEALDKERVDGEKRLESHVYEGIGHSTSGRELMDLCLFLERVVPP
jgi:predicted esterase